jgi:hypothetical protein
MNRQYLFQQIYFWVILILPVLLYFVPVERLNEQHTICLFKNIFGVECWGCGITRAVLCTLQFDFTTAFCYNKLIVIVFPLLVYVWGKRVMRNWQKLKEFHNNKFHNSCARHVSGIKKWNYLTE